ncbi:MAG: FAD-linked oxidase C-terminal domain-containing protein [bacterium]|nr:FAD-linked oxidase C-terminal domain-containing protein [bacterium]
MLSESVKQELIKLVGKDNYLDTPEDLYVYGYDSTPLLHFAPEAIIRPANTEEISAVVKLANQYKFPLIPRGSGTNLSGGSIAVQGGIVMVMNRMNRIIEIDKENLTATVEPGVITSELHTAVEKLGLFYPPDPGSMKVSTLGGNVAENAGGPRCFKYGVTKDYVLGLEIVLPTGEIIKTGGKAVKDVAGYNLTQLFIGSEGTLGVVTQIIVKLIPFPSARKTLLVYFKELVNAAQAVSKIVEAKVIPVTLEMLDRLTIKCVEDYAKIGLPLDVEALLWIEVDGVPAAVEADAIAVERVVKECNATEVKIAKSKEEEDQLAMARRSALAALARSRPTTILEDATVPRSNLAAMVQEITKIAQKYQLQIATFGHAGDGNLHPTILTDERDTAEMERVHKAVEEIFAAALKLGGTISGEHGIGMAKAKFLPQQVGIAGIDTMRKIKDALDPNNILNPGKIFLEKEARI